MIGWFMQDCSEKVIVKQMRVDSKEDKCSASDKVHYDYDAQELAIQPTTALDAIAHIATRRSQQAFYSGF